MKTAPFQHYQPDTVEQTVQLLDDFPEAKIMAGNQSLGIIMANRLATPDKIIDINDLNELQYIKSEGGVISIGSMTRHRTIEQSEMLQSELPVFPEGSSHIAGPAVRNQGTVGGSLAEADPAANHACVLLALGADIKLQSIDETRTVPIEDFFIAYMMTDVADNELLTEIQVHTEDFPDDRTGMKFNVKKETAQTWPTLGATAIIRVDDSDSTNPKMEDARLTLANAADVPLRVHQAEQKLEGKPMTESLLSEIEDIIYQHTDPQQEMHADEDYKRDLAATVSRRTLEEAYRRAVDS